MRFDRLRITGFKSFADPVEVDILPGLTGVVGPNGCGKSNVLEALRWVMGASSAKALRAGGMEDVIFGGSGGSADGGRARGRPARQWAEVGLVLDNEARTAPPAYNEHAVIEVTRRITRRPEGASSTFRINGREVRAKDVSLLFADASAGASSPALVRQGQVSELIAAKPENRRRLLEEAAGITGLHARRHEAELRLRAASANLERLDDVTGDLEARRAALARQARQALRYKEVSSKLGRAEALSAFLGWDEAREATEGAAADLAASEEAAGAAMRAAAAAGAERERLAERSEPLRLAEREAAAALRRLEVERDGQDAEAERAAALIARLEETAGRLADDRAREEALAGEASETLARLAAERGALDEAGAPGEAIGAADAAARAAGEALAAAEAAFEAASRDAAEAEAERRALVAAQDAAAEQAQRLTTERDGLARELSAADVAGDDGTARLVRLRDEASDALSAAERRTTEAEAARVAAAAALRTKREPSEEAARTLAAIQAEAKALGRLLAASAPEDGAVLDQVRAEAGAEAALAAALGDELSASLDEGAARHWAGRACEAAPLPGGAVPLAALTRAPGALSVRLAACGVVAVEDGPRLARSLSPGQRLVSREGDLWRWDGFTVRAGAPSAAALRLEQRRRAERLATDESEARASLGEATAALKHAEAAEGVSADEEREARRAVRTAREAVAKADAALGEVKAEAARRAARTEALRARREAAEEAARAAQTALVAAEGRLAEAPPAEGLGEARETARIALSAARAEERTAREAAAGLARDAAAREERLSRLAEDLAGWRARREAAAARAVSVAAVAGDVDEQLTQARRVPASLAEKRDQVARSLAAAESHHRSAAEAVATVLDGTRAAEAADAEARERATSAREDRARAGAVAEAARERLAAAEGAARQLRGTEPRALLELAAIGDDPLPSAEEAEAAAEKLRRRREAMGAVNLVAEQELAEVAERLEAMVAERQDCEAAIGKLRGAIGTLNRDGRRRLLAAFDEVNAHFAELFVALFGGGEAKLALTEADDPLEAGLEVLVSPPGKKLSSMSLMSGGEQALVATALIFAVFRANPAPVCVLDEVDAPLDDANVARFCDMLRVMAAREDGEAGETRFLVITHHALTMSRMDRLYGVTMVERGVSRLVSVDLPAAEAMTA